MSCEQHSTKIYNPVKLEEVYNCMLVIAWSLDDTVEAKYFEQVTATLNHGHVAWKVMG